MRSWTVRCGILKTRLHEFFSPLKPAIRSAFTVVLIAIGTACVFATNAHAQANHNAKIPVLVYHDIQGSEEGASNPMVVRLSLFKKQMQYLSDNGYQTLGLSELEDFLSGKKTSEKKIVALHFDDGLKSVSEVLPVLSEHRFKASFALVPGMVGVYPAMNWADISKIIANPQYDVMSHTMMHRCQTFVAFDGSPGKGAEKAEFDLAESRRILSEKAGKQVSALVWPCGSVSSASVKLAVRLGYTSIFVTDGQTNYAGSGNRHNIHRIPISGYCSLNEFVRTVSDGGGITCAPPKAK